MTLKRLKDLIRHTKHNPLTQEEYETLNDYYDNIHIPILRPTKHKYERR